MFGHRGPLFDLNAPESRFLEQEDKKRGVHGSGVIGVNPERVRVGVQGGRVHGLDHHESLRPYLLGREGDHVDDLLRRKVLDDLDHCQPAE